MPPEEQPKTAGGRGVDAVPVWLNRDNRRNNTSINPDYEIHTCADIKDHLGVE